MTGTQRKKRTLDILLVEDNPMDVYFTKEVLSESTIETRLFSIHDGQEAIAYLRQNEPYEDAIFPDLILLDLNLPKQNGFDVLAEIRKQKRMKHIPVIILTTSTAHEDISKAHRMEASCYLLKPFNLDDFENTVRKLNAAGLLQ